MKQWLLVGMLACSGAVLAQDTPAGKPDPFTGGSVEAGAAKAATCAACHGPAGNSTNPEWPKLAGQHAAYLYRSLKVLKTGERKSPVMNTQAAPLSDQDMRDLAAYFAAQKPTPGVGSPAAVAAAQSLYRAGDPQRGLPACAACHGPQGNGNAAAGYPRIGGQHAKYSAHVLRAYYRAAVPADQVNPATMAAIAAKLNDAEIEALASYVNGLH